MATKKTDTKAVTATEETTEVKEAEVKAPAKKTATKKTATKKAATKKAPAKDDTKQKVEGYEEDMAAVATAVYLYLNSAHDEESGVLTIQNDERSLWHAELNASV